MSTGLGAETHPVQMDISLDVFRNLFGKTNAPAAMVKGYKQYQKLNFSDIGLCVGWDHPVNKDLYGRTLVFLILMRPVLQWSKENFHITSSGDLRRIAPFPIEKVMLRCCTDAFRLNAPLQPNP